MIYGGALYSHSTKWTESENGYNSAHTGTTIIQGGAISQQIGNFPDGFYDSNKVGFTQYGENIFIKQGGKNASIHNEGDYSSITNGILGNTGTYIQNIGDDGVNDGIITLRGGTILLYGSYNAFLRLSKNRTEYYKAIGIGEGGNLIIGQPSQVAPYVLEDPNTSTSYNLSPLSLDIYTTDSFNIHRTSGTFLNTDFGNLAGQTEAIATNSGQSGIIYSNRLYSKQTGSYVYVSSDDNLIPYDTQGTMACGTSGHPWYQVNANNMYIRNGGNLYVNGTGLGQLAFYNSIKKNLI